MRTVIFFQIIIKELKEFERKRETKCVCVRERERMKNHPKNERKKE